VCCGWRPASLQALHEVFFLFNRSRDTNTQNSGKSVKTKPCALLNNSLELDKLRNEKLIPERMVLSGGLNLKFGWWAGANRNNDVTKK
jgi:hypothetical protein